MSDTVLSEKAFKSGMTLIYTAWHSLKPPEKTVSFIWFKMLSDIEDDVFLQACLSISTIGERAPQNIIAVVREQAEKLSGKMEWTEAYDTVKELFDHFYFPELGSSCWGIIQEKIKEMNKPELLPFAEKWGREMLYTGNPSAVRAQFRDAWKIEVQGAQLKRIGESQSMKQLLAEVKQIEGEK